MANNFLLPATSTLLLLILSASVAALTERKSLLDVDGNQVEAGTPYYVLTAGTRGIGAGGLTMAPRQNSICPQYVGQFSSWTEKGLPVTFFPSNTSEEHIYEGMNVNIGFIKPNYCRASGIWTVTVNQEDDNQVYVATDGSRNLLPAFKVERTGLGESNSYKFVYCSPVVPPILPPVEPFCAQLAPTKKDPHFGLSWFNFVPVDQPLRFIGFIFVKAEQQFSSSAGKIIQKVAFTS